MSVSKSHVELRGGRRVTKCSKSEAGNRVVSIPKVFRPEVAEHLRRYVAPGEDAVVFLGPKGGRLGRHNFRKVWLAALADAKIKKSDVHFHDLRHTGNDLAVQAGASTKELMARMGHSTMRAALIYQHASRERDRAIADKISRNVTKARRADGKRAAKISGQQDEGHAEGTTGEKAS